MLSARSLPEDKAVGRGVAENDHSHTSNVEVKNAWSLTSLSVDLNGFKNGTTLNVHKYIYLPSSCTYWNIYEFVPTCFGYNLQPSWGSNKYTNNIWRFVNARQMLPIITWIQKGKLLKISTPPCVHCIFKASWRWLYVIVETCWSSTYSYVFA
jgi:hypothetical protein